TVTEAIYEAGFNSNGRFYAGSSKMLGMKPKEYREGGSGNTIRFAIAPTVVGRLLVAVTDRGIATVRLGDTEAALVASLRHDYPKANLHRDTKGLQKYLCAILQCLTGNADVEHLPLDVKATAFQRKVWKVLQQIPRGTTRSYREIAQAIGQPTAARAVARACASNPVAVAIPCHRVVRGDGHLAGYRWGLQRKKRLLALERT
ncbi:MAG: methylated-DNA--[protein]-cysteine S-methyltransferase, partial [Nitrospirales bacterium]